MSKKTAGKIKTEWDLSLLYKSVDDPQMDVDIAKAEKAYEAFAKKYKNRTDYLENENALVRALKDYEILNDIPNSKAYLYLHFLQDLNSQNQKVGVKKNLVSQRLQKMANNVTFFAVNLSKIPLKVQKKFLASKKLTYYHYLLKKTFENGKHTLTEAEEKILSLKSLPAYSMWVESVEKMRSKQSIEYKGKKIPMSEASSLLSSLTTQSERIDIHNKITEKYIAMADSAEAEMNAVVTDKKIEDELRGFKESIDATILGYENDRETVLNLVKTVTEAFPIVHRFYRIKAKILKIKKINYADRMAPVGKADKKIPFSETVETLSNLFTSIDPQFGKIFADFLNEGRVDVYPKIGKTAGAYCAPEHNAPTFVLMNYTDNIDSMQTLAHEMGHAIHSEFSKSQSVFYESYSMSVAETASTLFEQFLFYSQFEKLSQEEKVIALHDKIQDAVLTIFRQIACFNFELEMHKTIREKGGMSKEEMAKCMAKHMDAYFGNNTVKDNDGYIFVAWAHIRRFFYVYTYAYGLLASKALYRKYSEDKTYIEKIKKFMSLGGSMSPEDIFKSIGVDVKKPDFWKLGVKGIEEDINLLEKLVNKQKKR